MTPLPRHRAVKRRARRCHVALAALALVASLAAACSAPGSGTTPPAGMDETVRVVATTTILADLVRQVGGDRVRVDSLVPKGGEVHTFDPTPSDVRRITDADLVLINGLGLDEWLAGLVEDAGASAPVLRLAEDLEGVQYLAGDEHEGEGVNPHLWLNAAYAAKYAQRIAEALAVADPEHATEYAARLAGYAETLAALDEEARATLGAIPEANRTVIAFHDAFPYFAAAYGLAIDGTIVSAPGQEPSAGEVSDLIRTIRERGIRAIFAEAQFSDDLVRTIADETGVAVVSDLYTDSVGDAPQDTYESMMRWNVEQVARALGGG